MKSKSLGLWTLALGPFCVFAACLIWGIWQEYHAWQHLRPQLANALVKLQEQRDIQRGILMSEQDPEQRRSTTEWNEIAWMAVACAEKVTSFGLTGPQQEGRRGLPGPKGDWPESVLASRIVEDAEPILDQLEVWLQDNLDSPVPFLTNSLDTVLRVCFQYSIFKSDSTNAMRALLLISNLNTRKPGFSHTDTNRLYVLIADSLEHDIWTAEQLETLSQEILRPFDIGTKLDESYQNRIDHAMASIVADRSIQTRADSDDPSTPQWSFSWDAIYLNRLLAVVARVKPIRSIDEVVRIPSLLQSTRQDVTTQALKSPMDVSFPPNNYVDPYRVVFAHAALTWHLGNLESNRRIVAMAVAIKRFEIQNNRWPTSVQELEAAGFDTIKLTGIDDREYRFEIEGTDTDPFMNLQSTETWDHVVIDNTGPFQWTGMNWDTSRRQTLRIR